MDTRLDKDISDCIDRLKLVLTNDELNRIHRMKKGFAVDVHDLAVNKAKRLVKNIIAINLRGLDIQVTHGYIHGTAIKDMLWREKISPRIKSKCPVKHNPGRTTLHISVA